MLSIASFVVFTMQVLPSAGMSFLNQAKPCLQYPQGSPLVVDLITRMLTADPAKRCTVSEMLQHPWVLHDLPPGTAELNNQLLQQASAR
jgi:serine/threonine protein kinase